MDRNLTVKKELSFSYLEAGIVFIGSDLLAFVRGGEPHIGCVVQAVPRLSLTGDGSVSVTSSVLNLTGHKDESICRLLAEGLCRKYRCTVVCTGGFHVDHITKDQIEEVMAAMEEILEEL